MVFILGGLGLLGEIIGAKTYILLSKVPNIGWSPPSSPDTTSLFQMFRFSMSWTGWTGWTAPNWPHGRTTRAGQDAAACESIV